MFSKSGISKEYKSYLSKRDFNKRLEHSFIPRGFSRAQNRIRNLTPQNHWLSSNLNTPNEKNMHNETFSSAMTNGSKNHHMLKKARFSNSKEVSSPGKSKFYYESIHETSSELNPARNK